MNTCGVMPLPVPGRHGQGCLRARSPAQRLPAPNPPSVPCARVPPVHPPAGPGTRPRSRTAEVVQVVLAAQIARPVPALRSMSAPALLPAAGAPAAPQTAGPGARSSSRPGPRTASRARPSPSLGLGSTPCAAARSTTRRRGRGHGLAWPTTAGTGRPPALVGVAWATERYDDRLPEMQPKRRGSLELCEHNRCSRTASRGRRSTTTVVSPVYARGTAPGTSAARRRSSPSTAITYRSGESGQP